MKSRAQLETLQRENDAVGRSIQKRIKDGSATTKSIAPEFAQWEKEQNYLDEQWANLKAVEATHAKMGGNFGNAAGHDADLETKAVVNPAASPLSIPASEYKNLFEAVQKRLPSYAIEVDTKGFMDGAVVKGPFGEGSFTSGTLPNILLPQNTLQLPYEPDRLLDHFIQQAAPIGPGVEWVAHTGNTNPAGVVSELGVKPDLGMQLTTHSAGWVKIAALASISMEIAEDFQTFMAFVPNEIYRSIVDAETNAFVNSVSNPTGLLNVSGTLTRAVGADTNIDAIRKAMNDIRVGPAFGKADLVAMHPTTWDSVSLTKSSTGVYLLNPNDPMAVGDLDNVFGAHVVTNTYIPKGTALVMDSKKAVIRWVRSGFRLEINNYGGDASTNYWTQNAIGFRGEIREQIGVQYASAINILTGLPTS
jgi:hypothetical protein